MASLAQTDIPDLHMPPEVAGGVLRAVDSDEGAEAVVGVHAEVVDCTAHAACQLNDLGRSSNCGQLGGGGDGRGRW